jgi:centrosomal protein CEP104
MSMGPSLDEELTIDKGTLETLKGLYAAKERAVNGEDFDEAKRIKVCIDRLKAISGHLGQLEDRKRLAIVNEDYDSAKLIKHEIDKLKESALKPAIAEV